MFPTLFAYARFVDVAASGEISRKGKREQGWRRFAVRYIRQANNTTTAYSGVAQLVPGFYHTSGRLSFLSSCLKRGSSRSG